jgi:uncharacterized repeat protein (TIGR02543 family)
MTWPSLAYSTQYEWYATVNDGFATTTGPIWNFTTSGSPATYQLTVTSTAGGTITAPASSPVTVNQGAATTITAVTTAGYTFTGWTVVSGSGVSIATPSALSTTATLTSGDATVRANFTLNGHTITATAVGSGTITPSGAVLISDGASQLFTVAANSGYHIENVVVDGIDLGVRASYTFTNVTNDHTISANFSPNSSFNATYTRVTSLQSVSITAETGEKPQSKVWTYDGRWFSVLSTSGGTHIYRLDGTTWSQLLQLSTATDVHADAKLLGSQVHILLFRTSTNVAELASVEYVPLTHSYQAWSTRPANTSITLDGGVETATIDIDTQGRMWLASDAVTDINVRWSDSPYSTWSSAITVGTGVSSDDISAVIALPTGNVGVLWSNQNARRFGFSIHTDGSTHLGG